jgi:hypothetical protein
MADSFLATHLMNRSEFYTQAPLTSIAISDSRFQDKKVRRSQDTSLKPPAVHGVQAESVTSWLFGIA